MKVLVAPDSFKDCLSARKVGEAIRTGILNAPGNWDIRIIPLADGGEGTAEALIEATEGKFLFAEVMDPLMRPVRAKYGILGDGRTAVIEMAAASGIELLTPEERNPWITTTYGTGQLLLDTLDKGFERIIIGLGGSATNDAGVGMAQALGIKFLNISGKSIGAGGGEISEISRIDTTGLDTRIADCEIIIACDVTNPLTGPNGASIIYGHQKGANSRMVKQLDINLKHLAKLVKKQLNREIDNIPGAGASGGLGAGFLAFTRAVLQPGFEVVSKETGLDDHVQWADLIITGEGKIDFQTQFGKTPAGVARITKKYNKPVIALAGTLDEGYNNLYKLGFSAIVSILDKPLSLEEAIKNTPKLLERCAYSIMNLISGIV